MVIFCIYKAYKINKESKKKLDEIKKELQEPIEDQENKLVAENKIENNVNVSNDTIIKITHEENLDIAKFSSVDIKKSVTSKENFINQDNISYNIDFFDQLKSQLPDENRIEEVQSLYDNRVYPLRKSWTEKELVCACIKECSKNGDNVIRFLNFFISRHTELFYNKQENLLDIYLYYSLLENHDNRLEAFWSIIKNYYETQLCIIPNLYIWCKKAIKENNDALLKFCKDYYGLLFYNGIIVRFIENIRSNGSVLKNNLKIKDFKNLLCSLSRVNSLLGYKGGSSETYFYRIAQEVFKVLYLLKEEQFRYAIDIIFLSEKFKEEKIQHFLLYDAKQCKNDKVFGKYICEHVFNEFERQRAYQRYIDEFNTNFHTLNGKKFYNFILKCTLLLNIEGKNEEKRVQLVDCLLKIVRNLSDEDVDCDYVLKCIDLLDLYNISDYDQKILFGYKLNQIANNVVGWRYYVLCVLSKIFNDLLLDPTEKNFFSKELFDVTGYIISLIKKLFEKGIIDFKDPIILDLDGISLVKLFELCFRFSFENIIDNFKNIILTDKDLDNAVRFFNYFKIQIPLNIEIINIVSEDNDSLWKKFLEQNSNNFRYSEKQSPIFKSYDIFKEKLYRSDLKSYDISKEKLYRSDLMNVQKYYDCFIRLLTDKYTGEEFETIIEQEKCAIIKKIFCNENYTKELLNDSSNLFKYLNCSFKTMYLFINLHKQVTVSQKTFFSFLFSYVLNRPSDSKDKINCLDSLIDLFKKNEYKINSMYYKDINNAVDNNFYTSVECENIDLAKAIILVEKQENVSGYNKETGFNILHVLILQNNSKIIFNLIEFLKQQQKVQLLKEIFERKADPQVSAISKVWKDKTALERVNELIEEKKKSIEECNYHNFNIPENINNDYVAYKNIKNILDHTKLYLEHCT